ncbi:MAG: hypothetical protein IJY69_03885 [Clostridia bacterium]|nr:hypothetical protein [Clostridia bacterium]
MLKKYYIAADGGGSKLQTVLYDECFRVIRTERIAGVNTLFKPESLVRESVGEMIDGLLDGLDGVIAGADLCMLGAVDIMSSVIRRHSPDADIRMIEEPVAGLASALKTGGAVSLSGTGSDAFFVKEGKTLSVVGGWGPLLGDEGSGYDIGLSAIRAAIYSHDGRGEKTAIYDLIMEEWKLRDLWEIVTRLAGNPDARHQVASVAALCSRAAKAGDCVALGIYEKAADALFLQIRTAINRHYEDWDGTVAVMGGAWKGHTVMLERFEAQLVREYPIARVFHPIFEPVAGCAVLRGLSMGHSIPFLRAAMTDGFSIFLHP